MARQRMSMPSFAAYELIHCRWRLSIQQRVQERPLSFAVHLLVEDVTLDPLFKATVILAGGGALTGEALLIHLGHFVSLENRLFLTRAPWRTTLRSQC